jgi:hypothetical protein
MSERDPNSGLMRAAVSARYSDLSGTLIAVAVAHISAR